VLFWLPPPDVLGYTGKENRKLAFGAAAPFLGAPYLPFFMEIGVTGGLVGPVANYVSRIPR
jgi:hypothetical protein